VVTRIKPPTKYQKLRVYFDLRLKTNAAVYVEDRHLKGLGHTTFPNATHVKNSKRLPVVRMTDFCNRATKHDLSRSFGLLGTGIYTRTSGG